MVWQTKTFFYGIEELRKNIHSLYQSK